MIPSSLNTRLLPRFPPLCFDTGEDQLPPWHISTLRVLELKWAAEVSGRKDSVQCDHRLPCRVVVCHRGGQIWNIAQCLTECCVSPPSVALPWPMHSFSVLSWSFVMRTVCATHTSGSAVEGMAVLCTISLRDKLSAIH